MRGRRIGSVAVATAVLLSSAVAVPFLTATAAAAAAGDIARVSVDSSGARVPGSSLAPYLSADGELAAFSSDGDLTAAGATVRGAFVHHASTGALTRIADGTVVGLSADGATLAVADIDQLGFHVYDLSSGSVAAYPIPNAYGDQVLAYGASLSANGHHLIHSRTGGGHQHLYVIDLLVGTEVEVPDPGTNWEWPTISDDGQTIAFQPALAFHPVVVIDRQSGATVFDPGGTAPGYALPRISPDGSKVLYRSVPGGSAAHVYVGTTSTGASTDLTPNETGEAFVGSWDPTGRYASLTTSEALVAADTNGKRDVYVYDTATGRATLASIGATGTLGDNHSGYVPTMPGYGASSLAAGASTIAFASVAANLVADDGAGIPEESTGPFGDPVLRTDVYRATPVLAGPPPPPPPTTVHVSQLEQLNLNQSGVADSTAASPLVSGTTSWSFNVHNSGTAAVTAPTISAGSGQPASQFVRFGPTGSSPIGSFPVVSTQPSLAPGADLSLGIGSSAPVSFAPGFDSVRSATPTNVPVGGGQQTVSITLTIRNPSITNLFAYLSPSVAGETLVGVTPPANLDQGEVLGTPPVPNTIATWSILGAKPNKAYTVAAVVQVPNATGAPYGHKDRLDLYSQAVSPGACLPSCGPASTVDVAEPDLDGATVGAGRLTYSVTESNVVWQPNRILSQAVHYPGVQPPAAPNGVTALEIEQRRLDLPATLDATPPGGDVASGIKAWAAVVTNASGVTVTPSFSIASGHDPAGFSIEDPLPSFGHYTPIASFPVAATAPPAPTGSTSSSLLLRSSLPVSFTPGVDGARSSAPSTIPVGGGQQTTTVAVTARDATATNLNGVVSGSGASVVSVAPPGNLDEGELFARTANPSTPDAASWTLTRAKLDKTYLITVTLQVANPFGVTFPYRPQVSLGSSQLTNVPCLPSCGPSSSITVADTSLDGAVPGSGRVTYSSSAAVRWTAFHGVLRTVRLFGTVPSQLVDVGPATAEAGMPVMLVATLADGGAPIAGKAVSLSLGSQSCSAATGVDGRVSCAVTAPTATGPAQVVARFAGSQDFLPATATATITLDDLPVVTSFTPTKGTTGTVVTLSGRHLDQVTQVLFGGAVGTITSITPTRLRASVPADATSGPITLVTPRVQIATGPFLVQPRVDSFTPGSGRPGDQVVVHGANFTGATSVRFGGAVAVFTVTDDDTITATVPLGAKSGVITVTTPAGTGSSADPFLVAPRVTSFTPNQGVVGTVVTLSGLNLTDAIEVRFGDTPTTFAVSGDKLVVTVPAGATTGLISVTSGVGTGLSPTSFKVVPTVSSFTPAVGAPGDEVTITGLSLTGAATVKFGGIVAPSFTVDSDSQITVTVPSGAKSGPIVVTTIGGTSTNLTAFLVAPEITSFTPAAGTTGTVVTVTGRNLDSVTALTVGGAAVAFDVVSATRLTLVIPPDGLSGKIVVTNPAGTGSSIKVLTIAPRILGFTPASASAGAAVSITGDNFAGATRVEFGAVRATFTVDPSGSIIAIVPVTARPGTLTVCNAGGCATSADTFAPTPRITSFAPISGHVGATVTINGTNLGTATQVTFNGVAAAPTSVTDTQVKVVVPAGATTGLISVSTGGGTATTSGTFTVT